MGFLFGSPTSNFQANPGLQAGQIPQAGNDIYNSIQRQNNFLTALQNSNPQLFQQQANLTNQMAQLASGQGPNPALSQLAGATGQNMQNTGALMASQRGVGNNPGLLARNIGQAGAGIQQQAANQAATLSAQQQIAAQQNLGNLIGQQTGQQLAGMGQLGQMALGNQGQLLGAQANANALNQQTAAQNAQNSKGLLGGLLGGVGGALAGPLGGLVGSALGGGGGGGGTTAPAQINFGQSNWGGQIGNWKPGFAQGGEVESHSLNYLRSKNMKGGGSVPGQAKVSGKTNSYKNDTVPAMLSPGEIVLPRSVTQDDEAADKAKKFVASILAKGGKR